jgi:Spy/CpxP family protein refolding chaperone
MRFNRTKTRYLVIITLAAAALLVAPVLAQPGPMKANCRGSHGAHGPGMGLNRMIEYLDLSAEQQEQMQQLRARHRDETEEVRDRLRAAHDRFADLAHAETLDETALREAASEMAGARAEMMVSRAAMRNEMRQILTPEQLERFEQMDRRNRGRMDERGRGRGAFGPHGPHDPGDCPRLGEKPDTSGE